MALELLFTSAPRGLRTGTFGYCTVARHKTMSEMLANDLEKLSGFDLPPGVENVETIYSFCVLERANSNYWVLCRKHACARPDYTGRSNYIAHHLVLSESEVKALCHPNEAVTPAALLFAYNWKDDFDGPPVFFEEDTPTLDSIQRTANSVSHDLLSVARTFEIGSNLPHLAPELFDIFLEPRQAIIVSEDLCTKAGSQRLLRFFHFATVLTNPWRGDYCEQSLFESSVYPVNPFRWWHWGITTTVVYNDNASKYRWIGAAQARGAIAGGRSRIVLTADDQMPRSDTPSVLAQSIVDPESWMREPDRRLFLQCEKSAEQSITSALASLEAAASDLSAQIRHRQDAHHRYLAAYDAQETASALIRRLVDQASGLFQRYGRLTPEALKYAAASRGMALHLLRDNLNNGLASLTSTKDAVATSLAAVKQCSRACDQNLNTLTILLDSVRVNLNQQAALLEKGACAFLARWEPKLHAFGIRRAALNWQVQNRSFSSTQQPSGIIEAQARQWVSVLRDLSERDDSNRKNQSLTSHFAGGVRAPQWAMLGGLGILLGLILIFIYLKWSPIQQYQATWSEHDDQLPSTDTQPMASPPLAKRLPSDLTLSPEGTPLVVPEAPMPRERAAVSPPASETAPPSVPALSQAGVGPIDVVMYDSNGTEDLTKQSRSSLPIARLGAVGCVAEQLNCPVRLPLEKQSGEQIRVTSFNDVHADGEIPPTVLTLSLPSGRFQLTANRTGRSRGFLLFLKPGFVLFLPKCQIASSLFSTSFHEVYESRLDAHTNKIIVKPANTVPSLRSMAETTEFSWLFTYKPAQQWARFLPERQDIEVKKLESAELLLPTFNSHLRDKERQLRESLEAESARYIASVNDLGLSDERSAPRPVSAYLRRKAESLVKDLRKLEPTIVDPVKKAAVKDCRIQMEKLLKADGPLTIQDLDVALSIVKNQINAGWVTKLSQGGPGAIRSLESRYSRILTLRTQHDSIRSGSASTTSSERQGPPPGDYSLVWTITPSPTQHYSYVVVAASPLTEQRLEKIFGALKAK